LDEGLVSLSKIDENERLNLNSRIHGRALAAVRSENKLPRMNPDTWQIREIPYEKYPFTGELVMSDNKIFVFFMKDKACVFLLESKDLFVMLKIMFEITWEQAKIFEQARV